MAQPDQEDDFQRFHLWVKETSELGITAPGAPHDRFVPVSALRDYFERDSRKNLWALLSRIFPTSNNASAPSADDILVTDGYMLGFATLVLIGAGQYIETFIQRDDLKDAKMPFTAARPRGWPNSPQRPDLFQEFQKQQWVFCPASMDSKTKKVWEKERILPITSKEEIAVNSGADTFKITIHEDYCQLGKGLESSELVLKECPPNIHAQIQSRNEIRAFMHLRKSAHFRQGNIPIIKFFGSYHFEGDDTFYILLEYATGGTLEHMFERGERPKSLHDILSFWERLLKLVNALNMIHVVRLHEPDEERIIQGFHQDVKSDNILIVKRQKQVQHEGDFKLADLGLSHFREFIGENRTTKSQSGTKTYSAPECYYPDPLTDPLVMNQPRWIKPDVDVWSLGGIISEAAVWVKHGWEGLKAYRNKRLDETKLISEFQNIDVFHDGRRVLRCVKAEHNSLREHIEQTTDERNNRDSTTLMVLNLIDSYMLVPSDTRKSAKFISEEWLRARRQAEKALADRTLWEGTGSPPRLPAVEDHRMLLKHRRTTSKAAPSNGNKAAYRSFTSPIMIPNEPPPMEPLQSDPKKSKSKETRRQKPPPWPKKDALDWLQDRESRNGAQQDLDKSCCQEIKGRDHYFLIDDSLPMRDHWPQVRETMSVLSEIILSTHADDNIDVAIIAGDQRCCLGQRKAIEDFVKNNRPISPQRGQPGLTNPGRHIKLILDDYSKKMQEGRTKQRFSQLLKKIGGKPLTLYILTDGKYQGNSDLGTPIRNMVNLLEELGKDRYFVGIQFIFFGDDEEAHKRLKALDRLKHTENLPRDIVDEEPQDGCVWKLLLGSINETYDMDSDEDDDDDNNNNINDVNDIDNGNDGTEGNTDADSNNYNGINTSVAKRMSSMKLNGIR